MSKLLKVFVYGTLKVGGRFADKFNDDRLSTKIGTVKGTMFSVHKSFPALILKGDTTITGEIHEYDNAEAVEKALDMIEGYGGKDEQNNLYNKEEIDVITEDGTEKCKVYIFARDTDKFNVVADGVWQL